MCIIIIISENNVCNLIVNKTFSAKYFGVESVFKPCSYCKINRKINYFDKCTFFIVTLSEKAVITSKIKVLYHFVLAV